MKKRIFALLSALVLTFSFAPSFPAAAADQSFELSVLAALGIMNGDQNGNLNLSSDVTRAEFTKMIISASVYKDVLPSSGALSPYPDVQYSYWASGYISAAKNAGLINGYLDGTFRPADKVSLAEAATVVLKLLGYSQADFPGAYPTGQISLYRMLNLNKNISASANSHITRGQCARLIYNAFTATTKSGISYAASMGYSLDSAGEVDYLALINSLVDGPFISDGSNLLSSLDFYPTSIYRNDKPASISDILQYDVIYYLKEIKTVWAYSSRVTGTCESILPNKTAPSSVIVSGTQYPLETSQIAFDFSSLGNFKTGDTVTLALGRDGTSAAFALDSAKSADTVIYGLVTAKGTKDYTDAGSNTYSDKYIQVTATDGNSYQYKCSTAYIDAGDIVSVSFSDGDPSIKRCTLKSLSGTVNSSATALGTHEFSDDIEIIDTLESSAVSITPERLKNVQINSSGVLFYALDQTGKISDLILKNVTGDLFEYGILTSASDGAYKYILDGSEQSYFNMSVAFSVKSGPFGVFFKNGAPSKMINLSYAQLNSIGASFAQAGNKKYSLASNLRVYERSDGQYLPSSLDRVADTNKYSITGYYDKDGKLGGQIRVIVAIAK